MALQAFEYERQTETSLYKFYHYSFDRIQDDAIQSRVAELIDVRTKSQ